MSRLTWATSVPEGTYLALHSQRETYLGTCLTNYGEPVHQHAATTSHGYVYPRPHLTTTCYPACGSADHHLISRLWISGHRVTSPDRLPSPAVPYATTNQLAYQVQAQAEPPAPEGELLGAPLVEPFSSHGRWPPVEMLARHPPKHHSPLPRCTRMIG